VGSDPIRIVDARIENRSARIKNFVERNFPSRNNASKGEPAERSATSISERCFQSDLSDPSAKAACFSSIRKREQQLGVASAA
jgi:hypothetical protein